MIGRTRCSALFPAFVCSLTALSLAPRASAQTTVYSTGFENPPYANGSVLVGQDGWVAPANLSPNAAVVSIGAALTGVQGIRVSGSNMVSQALTATLDAVGSYRRQVDYNWFNADTPIIRLVTDVRLDGPQTTEGTDFFAANIAIRSGTGSLGELSISSDGMVYGYDGVSPSPDDNNPAIRAPIALGAWHRLVIEANYATATTKFFADGNFLGQFVGDPDFASHLFGRGAMVTYAHYDTDTLKRANYTASYDNFTITASASAPEPGTLGLLTAAMIPGCVLLRRWKRGASGGK